MASIALAAAALRLSKKREKIPTVGVLLLSWRSPLPDDVAPPSVSS
jgi:hypothetical protein